MPDFNPLQYPIAVSELRYFSGDSAWTGHIPFALALVQMARPRTIVELGTYLGDSYCAFCQAVAELKLRSKALQEGLDAALVECLVRATERLRVFPEHFGKAT